MPRDRIEHDVFVSHASEDKHAVARPLAEELQGRGLRVWYDEFSLRLGDSPRRSIDRGLARSRFGVVILSRRFFAKEWTQYELDSLVARQTGRRRKIVLPIWYEVSRDDVLGFSPKLADLKAASWSLGLTAIADAIVIAIPQLRKRASRPPLPLLMAEQHEEESATARLLDTLVPCGQCKQPFAERSDVPAEEHGAREDREASQRVSERLATDTRDVGLEGHRRYLLQAWPRERGAGPRTPRAWSR